MKTQFVNAFHLSFILPPSHFIFDFRYGRSE